MGKEEELITHEAIVEKFAELRAQSQQIAQKANEIAADSSVSPLSPYMITFSLMHAFDSAKGAAGRLVMMHCICSHCYGPGMQLCHLQITDKQANTKDCRSLASDNKPFNAKATLMLLMLYSLGLSYHVLGSRWHVNPHKANHLRALKWQYQPSVTWSTHLLQKTYRDSNLQEHESVLKALEGLDPERKCFRQVGGVLVERTVGEVVPAVKNNREQLEMVQIYSLFLCHSKHPLQYIHACKT